MTFLGDSNKIADELRKASAAKRGRTTKALPRHLRKRLNLPPEIEGVSLMTSADICEALRCSVSWWNEQVRNRLAPQPDVQRTRFARWYVGTIREYLVSLDKLPKDTVALKAKAKKASDAAKKKRGDEGLPLTDDRGAMDERGEA